MPILLIESGKAKGEAVKLPEEGAVTAGREKACDLRIPDVMASRRHFELRAAVGGRFTIRDLKSSNGTWLNGARLAPEQEQPVELEDKIQVGSTLISLVPAAAQQSQGELTGRTIGGYRVEERIGRGAMGTVYKAVQLSLERVVALKILARELAQDKKRVEMFLTEAREAGKLNHPNIVQVYDVASEGDLYFFSTEYMAKGSVEEKIHAEGKCSLAETLRLAIDAAKGLEYAERQGIIHRDIKPANLLVNAEGVTKIGDLGIARRIRDPEGSAPTPAGGTPAAPPPAETDGIAGSPLYMAPEQARGEKLDHRADLYALGATLYQALAGAPPFEGSSPREVILKHMNEEPRPLALVVPDVPEDVSGLVARLLAKKREERPASATALLEELRALEARSGAGTLALAGAGRAGPSLAAIIVGVALATVLLLGGGIGLFVHSLRKRAHEQQEAARRAAEEARERELQAARLAEAKRQAAESAAKLAREREAQAALEEANVYQRDHIDDLEGVLARHRAVVEKYPGTAAEAQAKAQIASVLPLKEQLEKTQHEREAREAEAKRAIVSIADAIETTPPEKLQALRERLEAERATIQGTEAAKQANDVRRAIMAKIDRARKAAEDDAKRAVDALDTKAARTAVDRVASWNVTELRPWVDTWRSRIDGVEKRSEEQLKENQKLALEAELALVKKTDDREKLRAFRHPEVRAALETLAARLHEQGAKDHARDRIKTLELEIRALDALRAHVNEGKKPALSFPLGGSMEGVAAAADQEGIDFRGKNNPGIQVRRAFASLSAQDLSRFFAIVDFEPKDAFGYATAMLYADIGDEERARRELGKTLAGAGPEIRPLVERALAGKDR